MAVPNRPAIRRLPYATVPHGARLGMMPARRYTVAHVSERQTPPAVEVGVDTEPPVTTDELTTPQCAPETL